MVRLSHTFSPALALCFGIQVGHRHDPHNFWIKQCPCSEDRQGCGAPHSTQQHLAQRQGSVHLLVVHFGCDSHILFQLPHGKLETQLSTLKPAPTVSRSSAVGKAVSLLKILKTALLILGTMSCTEELGMSKASDSTQYVAVCVHIVYYVFMYICTVLWSYM